MASEDSPKARQATEPNAAPARDPGVDPRGRGGGNPLKQAAALGRAGRLVEAQKLYRLILAVQPDHVETLHACGVVTFRLGHADQAAALLEKAVSLRPNHAECLNDLGNVYRAQGRRDAAGDAYRRAIALKPDLADAIYNLGVLHQERGSLGEAEECYRRALKIDPAFAEAHNNLGNLLSAAGELDEAEACYRKALAANPRLGQAGFNLGEMLRKKGALKGAEAAYRRTLEISPDFPEAWSQMGRTLLQMGRIDEARRTIGQAIEQRPDDAEAYNALADVFTAMGETDKALGAQRKAMRLAPGEPGYRYKYSALVTKIVPAWHFPMMNDRARNEAYRTAIEAVVGPQSHVLEIGTGSGLLAMMAARAGAKTVTTCEMVHEVAERARRIIHHNGYADRITLIEAQSTDLAVGRDLPEPADVLISEILSSELLGEGVLVALRHARRRLLKPGAPLIPWGGAVMAYLVGPDDLKEWVSVASVCGFDLSPFNELAAVKAVIPHRNSRNFRALSDDVEVFSFDFRTDMSLRASRDVDFPVAEEGTAIGIIQWIKVRLHDDITFENHPARVDGPSGWQIMFYRFVEPIAVRGGDRVRVNARYAGDRLFLAFGELIRRRSSVTGSPDRP